MEGEAYRIAIVTGLIETFCERCRIEDNNRSNTNQQMNVSDRVTGKRRLFTSLTVAE